MSVRVVVPFVLAVALMLGWRADPRLGAALTADDPAQRIGAARAAGELGVAGAWTVPALTEALHDPAVRPVAVWALGEIGPAAAPAIPALAALVASSNDWERAGLAAALGKIDAHDPTAAAALAVIAATDNVLVHKLATDASALRRP